MRPPAIDRRAVLRGAVVGFVAAVAVIVAWNIVDAAADLRDSALVFVFYLVVVAAWVASGVVAARRAPDAPYTHAGLAAAASALAIVAIVVVIGLARDGDVRVFDLLFHVIVAASAGIFGGLLTVVRPRRPDSPA